MAANRQVKHLPYSRLHRIHRHETGIRLCSNYCARERQISVVYDFADARKAEYSESGRWQITGVRTGVRALPPRDNQGSLPLAGRVNSKHRLWVVGGLGARGLVYHAWLGSAMAQAVLADDESVLPEQLRRWQT